MLHPRVVMPALAVLVILLVTVAMQSAPQVLRSKELYWLERRLERVSVTRDAHERGRVLSEFLERLEAGRLPQAPVDIVVRIALAVPADEFFARHWPPGWSDLLEALGEADRLDEEEWRHYHTRLLEVSRSGDVFSAPRALEALKDSLLEGRLDEEHRRQLTQHITRVILGVEAHTATLEPAIEIARMGQREQLIDPDDWKTAVREVLAFEVRARERRRQGYELPLRFSTPDRRHAARKIYEFDRKARQVEVDGQSVTVSSYSRPLQDLEISPGMRLAIGADQLEHADSPGDHTVAVMATLQAIPREEHRDVFPTLRFEVTEEATFTTVPADESTVSLYQPTEDEAELLRMALEIKRVEIRKREEEPAISVEGGSTFSFGVPPVDVSFEVILLPGDERFPVGSFFIRNVERHVTRRSRIRVRGEAGTKLGPLLDDPPDTVDLVLRPDPERAEHEVEGLEIWGGELRVEAVPLVVAESQD